MSGADIITVTSGSGVPPAIIKSLLNAGPHARPLERNLARLPSLFIPERATVQPSLGLDVDPGPSVLYGRPISIKWAQPLTPRTQLLIANATDRWVRAGCPDDRIVQLPSWAAAARAMGFNFEQAHGPNGAMRQAVITACENTKAIAITSAVLLDGEPRRRVWGIFNGADLPEAPGAPITIELDKEYARLVRQGVAFAAEDTHRALVNRDQVAARLWVFLEAEQGAQRQGEFYYHLFAYEPGGALAESWTPAIADLLGLHDHRAEQPCGLHGRYPCTECFPHYARHRRDVARRVREALAVITDEDDRHAPSTLDRAKRPGMWGLLHRVAKRAPRQSDTTIGSARDTTIGSARDHDSFGAPEHDINARSKRNQETNSDSPSLIPILDVLRAKGWKRASEQQALDVLDIFGASVTQAPAVADHLKKYPGMAYADLFAWCRANRLQAPSRPIRTIDDIEEPPPPDQVAA